MTKTFLDGRFASTKAFPQLSGGETDALYIWIDFRKELVVVLHIAASCAKSMRSGSFALGQPGGKKCTF
jgi:hypothetical protein